jgi:AraC-like DNA-binding protein
VLLAVDRDQRVVGADRVARLVFGLTEDHMTRGILLRAVFDCEVPLLRCTAGEDTAACLTGGGGGEVWNALITPPQNASSAARRTSGPSLHTRPRIALLDHLPTLTPESPIRGGLPPTVARRIREYVDSHLDENVGLDTLASTAGLSVHHFARAFRQSVGEPPHAYLLRRRVERAQEMLKQTDLPLSDIALAVGFADHSHLTRHFKRLVGMTPSAARWHQR